MSISSIKENTNTIQDIEMIVMDMLPDPVMSIQQLSGGGNSQVYLLESADSKRYIVKLYFRHANDRRDRVGVEYKSLSFLWKQGIRNIPQPVALNNDAACAIYTYIEGNPIISEEVTENDIDSVIEFLKRLKDLRQAGSNMAIGPASEACFSAQTLVGNIESRLSRFDGVKDEELSVYLRKEFKPILKIVTEWCRAQYKSKNLSFEADITWDEKILSPSDFGFHNARCDKNHRIVFLDFEYFGWDDPAKTISDFLLHPRMELSRSLTERFLKGFLNLFSEQRNLIFRTRFLYPLYGLKWGVIFLNEFLSQEYSRRNHAMRGTLNRKKRQKIQLNKSKALTRQIMQTFKEFPYTL